MLDNLINKNCVIYFLFKIKKKKEAAIFLNNNKNLNTNNRITSKLATFFFFLNNFIVEIYANMITFNSLIQNQERKNKRERESE